MLRRPATTGFWMGRLPHWEVEDGRYFVTIHLSGAIPPDGMNRIKQLAEQLPKCSSENADSSVAVMRTIFRAMEDWMDRTPCSSLLSIPAVAEMVIEAIKHRVSKGIWIVYEYVLMPSHLRLFLSVVQGTLKETMEDFKRWTGHQSAVLLDLPNGRFWQDEWFDHWSRSHAQDERISRYIRRNPEAAGFVSDFNEWPYGSWHL